MREVTQATVSRRPRAIRVPRWSARISAMTYGSSRPSTRQIEVAERIHRRRQWEQARREQGGFDPRRQWIRQF
jgi:hypothetical protein